jgi:hypothetical protein
MLLGYAKYFHQQHLTISPHEALDGQVPDEVYLHRPRDKPLKDAKVIKGQIEKIVLGEGFLKAYRLKKVA